MPTLENLTARIQEAKQLDFGDILSESLALFKKTWVQGLLLQVLTGAVFIPVVLLMYLFFFGIIIGQLGNDYTDPNFVRGLLAGASVLGVLCFGIGVFLLLVAPTALTAAYFRIMKKLDYNEDVGFSDFFYFFKGRNLLKITTLLLYAFCVIIPCCLLCFIPVIYVIVPLSYTILFLAYNEDMDVRSVFKLSFKLGHEKWGLTFVLLIATYLGIYAIAMFSCGIGQLFLQAFMYHPVYFVYKHVVGFHDKATEIDLIGEPL